MFSYSRFWFWWMIYFNLRYSFWLNLTDWKIFSFLIEIFSSWEIKFYDFIDLRFWFVQNSRFKIQKSKSHHLITFDLLKWINFCWCILFERLIIDESYCLRKMLKIFILMIQSHFSKQLDSRLSWNLDFRSIAGKLTYYDFIGTDRAEKETSFQGIIRHDHNRFRHDEPTRRLGENIANHSNKKQEIAQRAMEELLVLFSFINQSRLQKKAHSLKALFQGIIRLSRSSLLPFLKEQTSLSWTDSSFWGKTQKSNPAINLKYSELAVMRCMKRMQTSSGRYWDRSVLIALYDWALEHNWSQ
jgi:hypothetical protein